MSELTYLQAISDGLREETRADERVFCEDEAEPLGDGEARWSGFRP